MTMKNSLQHPTNSISERDQELLSAYLDNELTVAERVNLERRLGAEPRLKRELEELQGLTAVLDTLAPLPLPRSFTLDPATVAPPRRFFPFSSVLQMGSGLAGLALVLLATVQLLNAGAISPAPMAAPMAEMAADDAERMAPSAPAAEPPSAAMAPAATEAPAAAAEMAPLATEAPAAASSLPSVSSAAEPSGGAAAQSSAAESATPPPFVPSGGAGGPPSIDATVSAMQSSDTAASDTIDPALEPAADALPEAAAPDVLGPGVMLVLGLALLGIAITWAIASRRRV